MPSACSAISRARGLLFATASNKQRGWRTPPPIMPPPMPPPMPPAIPAPPAIPPAPAPARGFACIVALRSAQLLQRAPRTEPQGAYILRGSQEPPRPTSAGPAALAPRRSRRPLCALPSSNVNVTRPPTSIRFLMMGALRRLPFRSGFGSNVATCPGWLGPRVCRRGGGRV